MSANLFPVYLLMISYKREDSALMIIEDYLKAEKPSTKTHFLIVENSDEPGLQNLFPFSDHNFLSYHHFPNKNKARAINFAVDILVPEEDALIICIDDDVRFQKDYLVKLYKAAKSMGNEFYFGTSFFVNLPEEFDRDLIPYLSGSALGQPDKQFEQMKRMMFLGFSYAFFKSQWQKAGGLDERFSPGSEYDLAAEESIFQKKLQHQGFKPFLVKNNLVEHRPQPHLYTKSMVRYRQEQNGFTHGFQNLISSSKTFKTDCIKQLAGHFRRCIILFFSQDRLRCSMKFAYTRGFFRAFLLFLKNDDNRNFLT